MLPVWLGIGVEKTFILERAQCKFVFNTAKQCSLTHDGQKIFFAQDLSAETMKARSSFNTVKKKLTDAGTLRGFTLGTCKIRALYSEKIIHFSTPEEVETFLTNL